MYLCYIDESGTPEIQGGTSHYVLAGLAIPAEKWKECENQIHDIKKSYGLENAEIHTGWLLRKYHEQTLVADFKDLTRDERRQEIKKRRTEILKDLQSNTEKKNSIKQIRKNYAQTKDYIHLTFDERRAFVSDIAGAISLWDFARLFAECVDKTWYDDAKSVRTVDEQALEQVISRFEQFLQIMSKSKNVCYGILLHDNNQTVAKRHTELMRRFHSEGTPWVEVKQIIETPLFVDSSLTSLIQVVDVCSYAIRRYLENKEEELFHRVIQRADSKNGKIVGVRHFTSPRCECYICLKHR